MAITRSMSRFPVIVIIMVAVLMGGTAPAVPATQRALATAGSMRQTAGTDVVPPVAGTWRATDQDPASAEPQAETSPPYFYSSGAIPPSQIRTTISNRNITPNSFIFLSVDATGWPGSLTRLPAIKVQARGAGFFIVSTADRTQTSSSGLPFNYAVFNVASHQIYRAGRAVLPAGARNIQIAHSAATTTSRILLTPDNTGIASVTLPALRITGRAVGSFVVSTLDRSLAPATGVPFSYLIVNDATCRLACGARIAPGTNTVRVDQASIRRPTGVFLTVDTGGIAGDPAVPGVKVESRGAGFFNVYTSRLENAPSTGIPFNWFAFYPPPQWEELGPTARSGNVWTVAVVPKSVDPNGWRTQYIGSSWGGVWKTTDGGDTWSLAWNQPMVGITRLAMAPGNHRVIYALSRDGYIYTTGNGGDTWTRFTDPIPNWRTNVDDTRDSGGGFLAVPQTGALVVCSARGVFGITILSDWTRFGPDPSGTGRHYSCTDVIYAPDGSYYVAFRDIGVWRLPPGGAWKQIHPGNPNRPIRIAAGRNRVVLNIDCVISINSLTNITNLSGAALINSWQLRPRNSTTPSICRGAQSGYAMAVAISPTDDNHFIAFGDVGMVTFNGGQTWRPNATEDPNYLCDVPPERCTYLRVAVDIHQAVFWDDTHVFVTPDFGSRYSLDGGLNWREALTNRQGTDGPPILEYYSLSVSLLDQFSRAYVVGNAQDTGAVGMIGRSNGFYSYAGEFGLSEIAPRSLSLPGKSIYRVYGTYGANPASLDACDFEVTGPSYVLGSGIEADPTAEDVLPKAARCLGDTGDQTTFPDQVTVIAASHALSDTVLIGLANGRLYRARPGTNARRYDLLPATDVSSRVSTIHFNSDTSAFVGFENGQIRRVLNPFGSASVVPVASPNAGKRVTAFAGLYGTAGNGELYVGYVDGVWLSTNLGANWTNVTGSSGLLRNNLSTGVEVVGLARDSANPHLYVATGHRGIRPGLGGFWKGFTPFNQTTATVLEAHTPANGTWTAFGQGLPVGMPITGLGLTPNNALYVSSQGRGIWWRRDVAALPPNSGVNRPESGTDAPQRLQRFVTTCSYPDGWRSIDTLEFKLAHGFGPEDGEPAALWAEFDESENLVRLYDHATGTWSDGTPGEDRVLRNEFVELHLAETTVRGSTPDPTAVEITWGIVFREPARGLELQQYLRVTDDKAHRTSWDKVGTWTVSQVGAVYLPLVGR